MANGWDFQALIEQALSPIGYFIKISQYNKNSIDEKRKLLQQLLEIVQAYSDEVEKDFYLKEIASNLDISSNIVYDSFNKLGRIREKKQNSSHEKQNFSSEEIAIWYILHDEKNAEKIQELLVFPEYISSHFSEALEKKSNFLQKLELSEKEKFKGIALMVEQEQQNEENSFEKIPKLCHKINQDIFKKASQQLKEKIALNDENALLAYSQLIQNAKKYQIK